MIESDVEAVVKAQISAVLPTAPSDFTGAWDVVNAGEVKGREKPGNGLHLSVVVAPRAFDNFTTPTANLSVSIALKVDFGRDPTGESFHGLCAAILDLLQTWQRSISAVKTAFVVTDFAPCGLRVDGGDISRDTEANVWIFTQSFTLRGVISQTPPPTDAPSATTDEGGDNA